MKRFSQFYNDNDNVISEEVDIRIVPSQEVERGDKLRMLSDPSIGVKGGERWIEISNVGQNSNDTYYIQRLAPRDRHAKVYENPDYEPLIVKPDPNIDAHWQLYPSFIPYLDGIDGIYNIIRLHNISRIDELNDMITKWVYPNWVDPDKRKAEEDRRKKEDTEGRVTAYKQKEEDKRKERDRLISRGQAILAATEGDLESRQLTPEERREEEKLQRQFNIRREDWELTDKEERNLKPTTHELISKKLEADLDMQQMQKNELFNKASIARVPILMYGDPGIGKTVSTRESAEKNARKLGFIDDDKGINNFRHFTLKDIAIKGGQLNPEWEQVLDNPENYYVLLELRITSMDITALLGAIAEVKYTKKLPDIPDQNEDLGPTGWAKFGEDNKSGHSEEDLEKVDNVISQVFPGGETGWQHFIQDDRSQGILFFDEINLVDSPMWLANIMPYLDRNPSGVIGEPRNWTVIAAANIGKQYSGQAQKFSPAQIDRFDVNYMVFSAKGWVNWAQKKVHDGLMYNYVVEFIQDGIDNDDEYGISQDGASNRLLYNPELKGSSDKQQHSDQEIAELEKKAAQGDVNAAAALKMMEDDEDEEGAGPAISGPRQEKTVNPRDVETIGQGLVLILAKAGMQNVGSVDVETAREQFQIAASLMDEDWKSDFLEFVGNKSRSLKAKIEGILRHKDVISTLDLESEVGGQIQELVRSMKIDDDFRVTEWTDMVKAFIVYGDHLDVTVKTKPAIDKLRDIMMFITLGEPEFITSAFNSEFNQVEYVAPKKVELPNPYIASGAHSAGTVEGGTIPMVIPGVKVRSVKFYESYHMLYLIDLVFMKHLDKDERYEGEDIDERLQCALKRWLLDHQNTKVLKFIEDPDNFVNAAISLGGVVFVSVHDYQGIKGQKLKVNQYSEVREQSGDTLFGLLAHPLGSNSGTGHLIKPIKGITHFKYEQKGQAIYAGAARQPVWSVPVPSVFVDGDGNALYTQMQESKKHLAGHWKQVLTAIKKVNVNDCSEANRYNPERGQLGVKDKGFVPQRAPEKEAVNASYDPKIKSFEQYFLTNGNS